MVIGIGNPIRGDDGIGPVVAEEICKTFHPKARGECECVSFTGSGLDLLGTLQGYDRAVLIDSFAGGQIEEGECCRVELPDEESKGTWGPSTHYIGIVDALRLARHMRVALPGEIRFYGIGVKTADAYQEGLSEALTRRVPAIVEMISDDLRGGERRQ